MECQLVVVLGAVLLGLGAGAAADPRESLAGGAKASTTSGSASSDTFRVFRIGSMGSRLENSYETLASFNSAVPCIRGGDEILLEPGKVLVGTLKLRECAEKGPGDTIRISTALTAGARDLQPARLQSSISAVELALDWRRARTDSLAGSDAAVLASLELYELGPIPATSVVELHLNQERKERARHPNGRSAGGLPNFLPSGLLRLPLVTCADVARCIALPVSTWERKARLISSGGESVMPRAVMRSSPWSLASSRSRAIDLNSGELSTTEPIVGPGLPVQAPPEQGYGVAFDDAPSLLDAPGEWYFSPTTRTLFLALARGSSAPRATDTELVLRHDQHEAEFQFADAGIAFWGRGGPDDGRKLLIENVSIQGSADSGIRVLRIPNIEIRSVTVQAAGAHGISIFDVTGTVHIHESRILNPVQNGIHISQARKVQVHHNVIDRPGEVRQQKSLGMDFNGIRVGTFTSLDVRGNTIRQAGYAGIMLSEDQLVGSSGELQSIAVQGNTVEGFCRLLNDCGAIYINGKAPGILAPQRPETGSKLIAHNKISQPFGNLEGTPSQVRRAPVGVAAGGAWIRMIGGIYLDQGASGYDVHENAVSGIFEPYGWKIFNGGLANTCGRITYKGCIGSDSPYTCYTSQLDQCNTITEPSR